MVHTTIQSEPPELSDYEPYDNETILSKLADEMGFPVAGRIGEIYTDAVIVIFPFHAFDLDRRPPKVGRVLERGFENEHQVISFVILNEDGLQINCSYGETYPCFFALPENTEGQFR